MDIHISIYLPYSGIFFEDLNNSFLLVWSSCIYECVYVCVCVSVCVLCMVCLCIDVCLIRCSLGAIYSSIDIFTDKITTTHPPDMRNWTGISVPCFTVWFSDCYCCCCRWCCEMLKHLYFGSIKFQVSSDSTCTHAHDWNIHWNELILLTRIFWLNNKTLLFFRLSLNENNLTIVRMASMKSMKMKFYYHSSQFRPEYRMAEMLYHRLSK